jgi:hypothetical protein
MTRKPRRKSGREIALAVKHGTQVEEPIPTAGKAKRKQPQDPKPEIMTAVRSGKGWKPVVAHAPHKSQSKKNTTASLRKSERPALHAKGGEVQATKYDEGKRRFLFPQRALDSTNDVFTYGADKYEAGNWHTGDGFDWDRLDDALERHLSAWRLGENIDLESGLPHLAHAMCCLSMLLEHTLVGLGKDTRSRNQVSLIRLASEKRDEVYVP